MITKINTNHIKQFLAGEEPSLLEIMLHIFARTIALEKVPIMFLMGTKEFCEYCSIEEDEVITFTGVSFNKIPVFKINEPTYLMLVTEATEFIK